MKVLHYLNTSFTEGELINFALTMYSSVPTPIVAQIFLRQLGVKYDTTIPTLESLPVGYTREWVCNRTHRVYIRQVAHL